MEFYLIQTFTTAVRPHFAEALRLVQDTASAEEDAHLTVLSSAAAFAHAAQRGSLRDAVLLFAAQTDAAGMDADTLALLRFLHLHEKEQPLAGSRAGILIDGENNFFTKDLGCRKPLRLRPPRQAVGGVYLRFAQLHCISFALADRQIYRLSQKLPSAR